jgi:hypothetical protein
VTASTRRSLAIFLARVNLLCFLVGVREGGHFRKVEGATMDVEYAERRPAEAAKELKKDDTAPYLIAALETAAGAPSGQTIPVSSSRSTGGRPPATRTS